MIGCSLDLGFWYWFVLGVFSVASYCLLIALEDIAEKIRNIAKEINK